MTVSVLVDKVGAAPVWSGSQTRGMWSSLFSGKTATRPLGARSGVAYNTPVNTITVSGTTYTIKPHAGVLDVESSTTAGPYPYVNDADVTGSHAAAHATNARKDLLSIRLDDPAAGDGTSVPLAAFVCTKGAEDGSNVAPATPARSMPLAWINVPASGGGASTITWVAPYMQGGVIPVRNATERAALYTAYPATTECPVVVWQADIKRLIITSDGINWKDGSGQFIWADATARGAATTMAAGDFGYQIDTAVTYRYSGSAWKAWSSDWITWATAPTNITVGTGGVIAQQYKYVNGRALVQYKYTLGSSGFSVGTAPYLTLPITPTVPVPRYAVLAGDGNVYDLSATTNYYTKARINDATATQVLISSYAGTFANIASNAPMASWGAGDIIQGEFWIDLA